VCCGLGESSGKQPDNDGGGGGGGENLAVTFCELSTVPYQLAEYLPSRYCPLFQPSSVSSCK
jgi:hypothetical protein